MQEQGPRVLIVGDEPHVAALLEKNLCGNVGVCQRAEHGEEAMEQLNRHAFDLVVSDIGMPGTTAIDLVTFITGNHPDTAVVLITGLEHRERAIAAIQLGAFGYILKPCSDDELLIIAANALERRRLGLVAKAFEEELGREVSHRIREVAEEKEEILFRLVSAMQYRDDESAAHICRIGLYSAAIARERGYGAEQVDLMRLAAPMHDIGKIGIPDSILRKPARLTDEEFEVIKKHTIIGGQILESSDAPVVQLGREIALGHHEKWDGSGYPQGLAHEAIPESARIVAIADVYDVLTHDRVYKPRFTESQALDIMAGVRGSHFDPDVFDTFLKSLPAIRSISDEVKEDWHPGQT